MEFYFKDFEQFAEGYIGLKNHAKELETDNYKLEKERLKLEGQISDLEDERLILTDRVADLQDKLFTVKQERDILKGDCVPNMLKKKATAENSDQITKILTDSVPQILRGRE